MRCVQKGDIDLSLCSLLLDEDALFSLLLEYEEFHPMFQRTPNWLRLCSLTTATVFAWTSLFALPAQLRAQSLTQLASAKSNAEAKVKITPISVSHAPIHLTLPKGSLTPLSEKEAVRAHAYEVTNPRRVLSLLNEEANLVRPVKETEAMNWLAEAASGKLSPSEAALRHVHFGEFRIGAQENPQSAARHFKTAMEQTEAGNPVHRLAEYDLGITLYQTGQYRQAYDVFNRLLKRKGQKLPPGFERALTFDRGNCALWSRHAAACAGYHQQRAKAGIVEPGRLDAKCGAAALAMWLRANKRDYSEKTVLSAVKVTGRGSRVLDVEAGARKLGLRAWTVGATEEGLKQLPKPLMAHVEHDHFISVVKADDTGVTYNCSDCGKWPGGLDRKSVV